MRDVTRILVAGLLPRGTEVAIDPGPGPLLRPAPCAPGSDTIAAVGESSIGAMSSELRGHPDELAKLRALVRRGR